MENFQQIMVQSISILVEEHIGYCIKTRVIYFDSYSCAPTQTLSKFIVKRNGHCLYSEYKTQGLTGTRDSFCVSFCLYIIYLTKVIGVDFKSAVLTSYHQKLF